MSTAEPYPPKSVISLVNACVLPAYDGRIPPDWIRRALDEGLAGVGLFGTNLTPAEGAVHGSLREDIVEPLRAVRPDALIALDEEGGDVTRLDYHRGSVYPGNHALGCVDDPGLTRQVARAIGADLVADGINLCFGPCADVNSQPDNPIIGVRSFGATPGLVARHTRAFVEGLQERGVAATLKHFPGHGNTGVDSHSALPDIDRPLDSLRALDLVPFAAGSAAGAKAVMTGHIRLPHLAELPATLSRRVVTGLLREELGYEGVVVSDALEMAPVLDRWGFGGAAVLAWSAGVDLVLLGASGGEHVLPEVYEAVTRALKEGELTVTRLEEAATRVTALRAWASPGADVGLIAARRALAATGPLAPPTGAAVHVVRLMSEANMAVGLAPWDSTVHWLVSAPSPPPSMSSRVPRPRPSRSPSTAPSPWSSGTRPATRGRARHCATCLPAGPTSSPSRWASTRPARTEGDRTCTPAARASPTPWPPPNTSPAAPGPGRFATEPAPARDARPARSP